MGPRQLLMQFQAKVPNGLRPDGPSGFVCNLPPCTPSCARSREQALPLEAATSSVRLSDASSAMSHLVSQHIDVLMSAMPGLRAEQLPHSSRQAFVDQLKAASSRDESRMSTIAANRSSVDTGYSMTETAAKDRGEETLTIPCAVVEDKNAPPPGFAEFLSSVHAKLGPDLTEDGALALLELASSANDVGPARRALLAVLEAGIPRVTRTAVLAA